MPCQPAHRSPGQRHRPTSGTPQAQAATNRLLYTYALPLLHQSADTGDTWGARLLAELLAKRGEVDAAITVLRTHAEAGDSTAADRLAKWGDVDTLQARAEAGDTTAARLLAKLLAERGEVDALQARAEAGDTTAARLLAKLLAERGDVDALQARAEAGDTTAARLLAKLLAERGEVDAARCVLMPATPGPPTSSPSCSPTGAMPKCFCSMKYK
jgi:hypothetical protein